MNGYDYWEKFSEFDILDEKCPLCGGKTEVYGAVADPIIECTICGCCTGRLSECEQA